MTTPKNKNTGANKSNSTVKKVKKAYVMPETVKAKCKANKDFKDTFYSLSGLVKLAKSPEGLKIVNPFIDIYNKRYGTNFKATQIDTRLIRYATEKEKNHRDGTKRTQFSFWFLESLIIRRVKDMAKGKAIKPNASKTPANRNKKALQAENKKAA